jgi:hypothetical protein
MRHSLVFLALFLSCGSAFAANPYAPFFGCYTVVQADGVAPPDTSAVIADGGISKSFSDPSTLKPFTVAAFTLTKGGNSTLELHSFLDKSVVKQDAAGTHVTFDGLVGIGSETYPNAVTIHEAQKFDLLQTKDGLQLHVYDRQDGAIDPPAIVNTALLLAPSKCAE